MASELSNYLANSVLAWLKGVNMPAAPAAVYVALFDGQPSAGGTERSTTIRTAGRVAVPWSAITARAITNSAIVDFGAAVGAANLSWAALYDASAGGNLLSETPLDTARTVVANDPVSFPVGDIVFNFN